ncbi:MAG: response regulator [Telluria sp.]
MRAPQRGVLVQLFPNPGGASPHKPANDSTVDAMASCTKVLVVDDNRDAADSLQALFEMDNCEVATAYDGYEALQAVEQGMPDVIVMDLGMPSMDGYEAARLIRRQAGGASILMIALTGWSQNDARQRTMEAGFDHHLIKPVSFDDIRKLANARFANG